MLMFKFIKKNNECYWCEKIKYIQHDEDNHKKYMEMLKTTQTMVKLQTTENNRDNCKSSDQGLHLLLK